MEQPRHSDSQLDDSPASITVLPILITLRLCVLLASWPVSLLTINGYR